MSIRKAGETNVGRKRNHNEDSFLIVHDQLLYIVADGMGGHAAGEVASRMEVETVSQFFKDTAEDDEITWPFKMDRQKKYEENRLVTAIKYANLRIYEEALANAKKKGMGTTIVQQCSQSFAAAIQMLSRLSHIDALYGRKTTSFLPAFLSCMTFCNPCPCGSISPMPHLSRKIFSIISCSSHCLQRRPEAINFRPKTMQQMTAHDDSLQSYRCRMRAHGCRA